MNRLVRKAPWPGLSGAIGMVILFVSSAITVSVSHDNDVTAWKVQPAVVLAILAAASNVAFTSALASGVAIRFWLAAARGTRLSQLHYIWDYGNIWGITSAIRAGPPARAVALLAVFAYIMQFAGPPLLQRSTSQVVEDRLDNQTLFMNLARDIPDGWLGTRENGSWTNFDRGLPIIQEWWRNRSLTTRQQDGYTCDGSCHGSVPGAGFAYQCWSSRHQLELTTTDTDGESVFLVTAAVTQNSTGPPFLRLATRHVSSVDSNCTATLVKEFCDLQSAIVEYPITIQNHTIYLDHNQLLIPSWHRVIAYTPSISDSPDATNANIGPLVALRMFARTRVTDNATKRYLPESDTAYYQAPGMSSDLFRVVPEDGDDSRCKLRWDSPTEYVLTALYDFMFRLALRVGNETEPQVILVQRTKRTLIFRTDGRYLATGLVVAVFGVGSVIILMWGWWHLERQVTMSPLETVSALGASNLAGLAGGGGIHEILIKVRDVEIKTGVELSSPKSTPR